VVESPAIIAAAVASPPVRESAPAPAPRLDLSAVAQLCASLSRVSTAQEIEALLEDAARMLDAVGLVVWSWEPRSRVLGPSLMHGYPDDVATRFPRVRRDGDNAVAAAFRSAETRVVIGDGATTGAVVVPMLSPGGCVGVFAVELRNGGEQHETVRALATILAAQLAGLVGAAPLAEAVNG
jgi:GAF domain-containing protein